MHMGGGLETPELKLKDIVSVDSETGIMAFGAEEGYVEASDSIIYGTHNMPNMDCPYGDECDQCKTKRGIWIPVFAKHATGVAVAPYKLHKMYSDGGKWGGSSLFKDLTFVGFDSNRSSCGGW